MKSKFLVSCSVAALAAVSMPAHAQVEIQWWHSMGTALGEWVNDLAKDFNSKQKAYKVVPVFKGSYDESMTAAVAAFRSGNAPHILQVFEVGTATMMASKGVIVPVGKVMQDAGMKFDPKIYVPAVAGYYTAPNGQMLSFPFNSSTPVFHYNKDAFKAAGMDPEKAAEDLAGGDARRRQAEGERPQVPVHHQPGAAGPSSRASRPGTTSSSRARATACAAATRG
jgi:sn-glycerol 3-phosphate transport system substrate-binding protein